MGEGTDAARAAVLTARGTVEEELVRLEASARAAVDVKAKIRRNPARTAGLAAGAGFLLLGGPKRVIRCTRRLVFGRPEPLPKSMLPKEIDKVLRDLGEDGEQVRGTIEREFAQYLRATGPDRRKRDLSGIVAILLASLGKPAVDRYGRQLVEQLLEPDDQTVARYLAKVRARRGSPTGDGESPASRAAADAGPAKPPA